MSNFDIIADRVKNNINYLMHQNDITSVSNLAKIINVPPTTIYSFLRSPLSNSKVKFKICNYFNVSIDELESYDFTKAEIKNDNELTTNQSILSMSDEYVCKYLDLSVSSNSDIDNLKSSIKSLINTNFRKCCGQARVNFESKNYQKALYYISSAFWLLRPEEIRFITESDLLLYIDIANYFKDNDLVSTLIIKLESTDFFNYKILIVLAKLLEESFPNESKTCYEIIDSRGL